MADPMGCVRLRSHYSDVMGQFQNAMHDVTNTNSISDLSVMSAISFSCASDSNHNISNNMFMGYGPSNFDSVKRLLGRESTNTTSDQQGATQDSDEADKGSNPAAATSNNDINPKKEIPDEMLTEMREAAMELNSPDYKPNPYTNWQPESGTERKSLDLSNIMRSSGVLQTLRSNLQRMSADMESDRYRESAMRLELRLSEMLSSNKPWDPLIQSMAEEEIKIKKSGSEVDPRIRRISKLEPGTRDRIQRKEGSSNVDMDVEERGSLLSNHISAMSDITLLSRKLSRGEVDLTNSYVESQINVMNSVLEDIKVSGTSVDPTLSLQGEKEGPIAALYDSLNIEKLRLQTIESLLNQTNPSSKRNLASIQRGMRRVESQYRSAARYMDMNDVTDQISSLSLVSVPSLVSGGSGRNISMNRHVTSSASTHHQPWHPHDFHVTHITRTNTSAASTKTKDRRRGSSKSSSNLTDSRKQSHMNRTSNIKKKTGTKTFRKGREGQGDEGNNNGLNKSQNWNTENWATRQHKPATPCHSQWCPTSKSSLFEYPGVNFRPQSVFEQWTNKAEHVTQESLASLLSHRGQDNKTNAKSSQISRSEVNVYSSTSTELKQDPEAAKVNSKTAVSTSSKRQKESRKTRNPYHPQIPIGENIGELEWDDDDDWSETSGSEVTDNSSITSLAKKSFVSESNGKTKTKVNNGTHKK